MGHEWKSKYICTFLLILPQIWLSWATQELPWVPYLAVAYVFGATITQALFLAIHELAHNLFFKKNLHNRIFSMFANLPIAIPCAPPAPHTWPASRAERTTAALAEPLTRARHASGG